MTTLEQPAPMEASIAAEAPEFEIVLGRRQMASLGLVAMVVLAVFSGLFYAIGKSTAPRVVADPPSSFAVPEPPQMIPPPMATPLPQPEIVKAPAPQSGAATQDGTPLFAEPQQGALYLQIGAVEKGVAQIWAEGLRTHELNAFVATGPSEKIFRVLVGPLADTEAYQRAKQTIDEIGLATFAKRIQQ